MDTDPVPLVGWLVLKHPLILCPWAGRIYSCVCYTAAGRLKSRATLAFSWQRVPAAVGSSSTRVWVTCASGRASPHLIRQPRLCLREVTCGDAKRRIGLSSPVHTPFHLMVFLPFFTILLQKLLRSLVNLSRGRHIANHKLFFTQLLVAAV